MFESNREYVTTMHRILQGIYTFFTNSYLLKNDFIFSKNYWGLVTYHNKLQKYHSKIHLLDKVILGEEDVQSYCKVMLVVPLNAFSPIETSFGMF